MAPSRLSGISSHQALGLKRVPDLLTGQSFIIPA
jgi:hypothetical protein